MEGKPPASNKGKNKYQVYHTPKVSGSKKFINQPPSKIITTSS